MASDKNKKTPELDNDGWEDVPLDQEGWEDVPLDQEGWEDVPLETAAPAPALSGRKGKILVKDVKSTPTPQEFNEIEVAEKGPSKTESFGAGYLKGVALNLDDELYGILSAAGEKGRQYLVRLGLKDPETNQWGDVVDPALSANAPSFTEEYVSRRDQARAQDKQHEETNPGTFLAGQVAGAVSVPTPKIQVFNPTVAKASLGAAGFGMRAANSAVSALPVGAVAGFGGSTADNVGDLALDTATGAGVSALGSVAGQAIGEGLGKAAGVGRRFAEYLGFRALTGKSPSAATAEAADNIVEQWAKSGKDVELADAAAAAGAKTREMAKASLDDKVVRAFRGTEGMKDAVRASSKDAVQQLRKISGEIDKNVSDGFSINKEALENLVDDFAEQLKAADPQVDQRNRLVLNLIKKYVKRLADEPPAPPPAQGSLFPTPAVEPKAKVSLRDAWEMIEELRSTAQKKNEVGRYVLTEFADIVEMNLLDHIEDVIDTVPGAQSGAGTAFKRYFQKLADQATRARDMTKVLAARSGEAGGGIGLAGAGVAIADPVAAIAASVGSKAVGGAPGVLSTAATAANTLMSKVPKAAGKALEKYSPKIAQTATVVGAPTWEGIKERLTSAPQTLGPYAKLLQDAAKRGDSALAATHFILSQKDPEYQRLVVNST